MRTIVTLDPDVEKLLRKAVRASGLPFKQVLNNAVRHGLSVSAARAEAEKLFRQPTFHMGEALVDLTKANALLGELEDQDFVEKMRQGR